MTRDRIIVTERLIEQTRIALAKEWAVERGMQGIEDMSDEDWLAIYVMLLYKSKIS